MRELADVAAGTLRARLEAPPRDADDWSIQPPKGCECELCTTLADFLLDAHERELRWPLAQAKRQHLHSVIDRAELPVSHVTERSGRPYTLILRKAEQLFVADDERRAQAAKDLAALERDWNRR